MKWPAPYLVLALLVIVTPTRLPWRPITSGATGTYGCPWAWLTFYQNTGMHRDAAGFTDSLGSGWSYALGGGAPWRWYYSVLFHGPRGTSGDVYTTRFLALLGLAVAPAVCELVTRRLVGTARRRRVRAGRCTRCAYDLTGNTSGVCPECGTPVLVRVGAARGDEGRTRKAGRSRAQRFLPGAGRLSLSGLIGTSVVCAWLVSAPPRSFVEYAKVRQGISATRVQMLIGQPDVVVTLPQRPQSVIERVHTWLIPPQRVPSTEWQYTGRRFLWEASPAPACRLGLDNKGEVIYVRMRDGYHDPVVYWTALPVAMLLGMGMWILLSWILACVKSRSG